MKKHMLFMAWVVLLAAALPAADVGPTFLYWDNAPHAKKISSVQGLAELQTFFDAEMGKGNLVLDLVRSTPSPKWNIAVINQFYKGIPVFGGQLVFHEKSGRFTGLNGEYYTINAVDIQPKLDKLEAEEKFMHSLSLPEPLELSEPSALCIYPIADDAYRLAYRVTVSQELGFSQTGLIDASDGSVLLSFSNIKTDQVGHRSRDRFS